MTTLFELEQAFKKADDAASNMSLSEIDRNSAKEDARAFAQEIKSIVEKQNYVKEQQKQYKSFKLTDGKSQLTGLDKQLALTSKYIAEPYEMLYDPISKLIGGKPLSENLSSIYSAKPETTIEKVVEHPSKAMTYTMTPLSLFGPYTPKNVPLTGNQAKDAFKSGLEGAKRAFLTDPKSQAQVATLFGLGSGGASLVTDNPYIQAGAGIATPFGTKIATDLALKGKTFFTTPTSASLSKADQIIDDVFKTANIDKTKISDTVYNSLKQEVDTVIRQNKNVSPTALKTLLNYKILGITPSKGRIQPAYTEKEQLVINKKGQKAQDELESNQRALVDTFESLGARNAVPTEQAGTKIAESIGNRLQERVNQFDNRYTKLGNIQEGRNVLFDHVYFTNKIADKLASSFKQYAVPKEIQTLMNDIATRKMTFNLQSTEQLRSFLGTAIAGAKGNEKAALRTIKDILEETPILKGQNLLDTQKSKQLREGLDSVRQDYKAFKREIESDSVFKDIFSGKEIKPNFFETKILNKTSKDLKSFMNKLTSNERQMISDNFMAVLKDKVVQNGKVNIEKLSRYLRDEQKLKVLLNDEQILKLKAIKDVAQTEKYMSTFTQQRANKSILDSQKNSFFKILRNISSTPTKAVDLLKRPSLLEDTSQNINKNYIPTFSLLEKLKENEQ